MNSHDQANTGGVLTPGDSGTGPTNGAPTSSFFISFATAGTIAATLADGTSVVITNGALVAGVVHPIAFQRIRSTGTGASGMMWWA